MAVILYKAFRPTGAGNLAWWPMADWLTGRAGGLQAGRDPLTIIGISGAYQGDVIWTVLLLPDGRQLRYHMLLLGTMGKFLRLQLPIPPGREVRLVQYHTVVTWNATVILKYIEGDM